jgi:peptide chain release factor 3
MLTPVFFGSALQNFGVEIFLKHFLKMALPPTAPYIGLQGPIDPYEQRFFRFRFQDPGEHE